MQIPMPCIQCVAGSHEDQGFVNLKAALHPEYVEINDQGLYTITCSKGHITSTLLQQHKHETLFELASFAILDGYYREAITSYSSCLERFYEFSVDFLLHKQGCDNKTIKEAWATMSRQSERQLGAYITLFTAILKTTPQTLENKATKYRNDVVHKGLIPSRDEAIQFGNNVLTVIRSSLNSLKDNFHDFKRESTARRLENLGKTLPTGFSSTSFNSSIFASEYAEFTLEDYLKLLERSHATMAFERYLNSPGADPTADINTAVMLGKISNNQ